MMGLATEPQRRSATMVAARYRSWSVGSSPRPSQTKMSGSAILWMVAAILPSPLSTSRRDIRGGILSPRSITLTRLAGTPDRPMRRSTASGGQVAIRRVGRVAGLALSKATLILVRFCVAFRVASTSLVVSTRVSRKALGANRKNQSLYISTDRAMSSFHRSGLSLLTAIARFPCLQAPYSWGCFENKETADLIRAAAIRW